MNDQIINLVTDYIDLPVAIIIICSGFLSKKYLGSLQMSTAWKTLLLSVLLTGTWIILLIISDEWNKGLLMNYFITYLFVTSFYELFLKKIQDSILKWSE